MKLHELAKVTKRKQKRLGQGHGSGRVKTAGRGQKGQKARHSIALSFEGGALPLIKRIPFLRGKGRNFAYKNTPVVVNVEKLNVFSKNSVVDIKALAAEKVVKEKEAIRDGVKILGNGKLDVAVIVRVPASKSAQEKIEKAGGRVELAK